MGSEQSSVPPKKPAQRAPPVRRGHTIAVSSAPEACRSSEPTASGNNSPGASVCSDSELPYISYTVDRPIGDSPKTMKAQRSSTDNKKSILQRRQLSLQARKSKRARDIVVVKPATDSLLDEDIRRLQGVRDSPPQTETVNPDHQTEQLSLWSLLQETRIRLLSTYKTAVPIRLKCMGQEIPTFLPIMRGTLGLPGARDPEVLEGLDYRPWVRLTARLQAHLAACAQPLAADEIALASKIKESDTEISRLYSQMVDKQRNNARHAERLARVHEVAHQLSRCNSLLNQTLQDIEELNNILPEDKRLAPFVWSER